MNFFLQATFTFKKIYYLDHIYPEETINCNIYRSRILLLFSLPIYEMIAIGFLNNAQFHLNQGMHGFYFYFTKAQRLQRTSPREIVTD